MTWRKGTTPTNTTRQTPTEPTSHRARMVALLHSHRASYERWVACSPDDERARATLARLRQLDESLSEYATGSALAGALFEALGIARRP